MRKVQLARYHVYCAFCHNGYSALKKKHISWKEIFWSISVSAVLSLIFFQTLHPMMIFVVVALITLIELLTTIKWRQSVSCPSCGFDPILYKKKPEEACSYVKRHMEKYKGSARHYMSGKSPYKNLIQKQRRKEKKNQGVKKDFDLDRSSFPEVKENQQIIPQRSAD